MGAALGVLRRLRVRRAWEGGCASPVSSLMVKSLSSCGDLFSLNSISKKSKSLNNLHPERKGSDCR